MVPDTAETVVDVRFRTAKAADTILTALRSLKPVDPRASLAIDGGIVKPVFEPNTELLDALRGAAADLGLEIHDEIVGGGSDGNYTAGVGVPTMDGLGATGEFLHNPQEHIYISQVPQRIALLAGLICKLV